MGEYSWVYLRRFPEGPSDPGAVLALPRTSAGAQWTHGVLRLLPGLHRDPCGPQSQHRGPPERGWLSCTGYPRLPLGAHSLSHTHTHTRTHAHTHRHAHIQARTHRHVHTQTYRHAHTNTHTHTQTHTHGEGAMENRHRSVTRYGLQRRLLLLGWEELLSTGMGGATATAAAANLPVVTSLNLSSSSVTSSSSTLRPGKKKPIILLKNWYMSWMVRGTTFTCRVSRNVSHDASPHHHHHHHHHIMCNISNVTCNTTSQYHCQLIYFCTKYILPISY